MREIFEADSLDWQQVRPEVTSGVYGRTLLDTGEPELAMHEEPLLGCVQPLPAME
jgi:hypothetical protein